jgi:hypothetical protein
MFGHDLLAYFLLLPEINEAHDRIRARGVTIR